MGVGKVCPPAAQGRKKMKKGAEAMPARRNFQRIRATMPKGLRTGRARVTGVVVLRLNRVRCVIQDDVGWIEVGVRPDKYEERTLVADLCSIEYDEGAIDPGGAIRVSNGFGGFMGERVVRRVD